MTTPEPTPPVDYRRRALECADRSDVTRSVMWSLLAVAQELAEIRRELKRRK